MSAPRFARLAGRLHEALAGATWVQWHALGGQVAARAPASIVDPEALVLASLWLADDEPRLRDLLAGFAHAESRRLSVQRMRGLVRVYPVGTLERLAGFARMVGEAPGDHRWRKLAGPHRRAGALLARTPSVRGGKLDSPADRLHEPASLVLRLRSAFGVDVRSDVLACLLGGGGAWTDVRAVAGELGYAANSVRGACEQLVEARFVEAEERRPARYRVREAGWRGFLGLRALPPWHPWARGYALAINLRTWLRASAETRPATDVARMLSQDWMAEHRPEFTMLDIEVPERRGAAGPRLDRGFEKVVEALAGWLEMRA